MTASATEAALGADWLDICRRAEAAARRALNEYPPPDRWQPTGRGAGGDIALAIDRAAEDAILRELDETGLPLTVITEERGQLELAGGGPVHVVVDPIDGSRNAKRGLPPWAVSIAVADGPTLGNIRWAFVRDGQRGDEWWARAGEGAFHNGVRLRRLSPNARLEMVGLEFIHPNLVADAAAGLVAAGIQRLRAIGSIALTLCYVASGQLDGMVALGGCRSVDIAAGQLILREVGGLLAFLDSAEEIDQASLSLDWRSRVLAAAGPSSLEHLSAIA